MRHLHDEISLLEIRLRKADEIEARNEGLVSQNLALKKENEALARELSERRYEVDRYRSSSLEIQER